MKKLFIFFVVVTCFFAIDVSAAEYTVSSDEELSSALSAPTESDTINLNADIIINKSHAINGNVVINGNGHVLSFDDAYVGTMFTGCIIMYVTINKQKVEE